MKLDKLRALMRRDGIGAYIVQRSDPHQSEYLTDYWNGVKFISGFTGSNGTVVVTADKAGLWTDGRYYIQAQQELAGSDITLYRDSEPGTVKVADFCRDNTNENEAIGFDARTMSAERALFYSSSRALKADNDLIGEIWENRGKPYGTAAVYEHDIKFCGKTRAEKLRDIRSDLSDGVLYIISSLDDIAWLFNLRGGDIENNAVFYAFAAVSKDNACLYVDAEKISGVKAALLADGVEVKGYEDIYEDLICSSVAKILLDPQRCCYKLYKCVPTEKIKTLSHDFTTLRKAIKNNTEIKNIENAFIKDGVALVKFIKWIKEAGQSVTEHDAETKLLELRTDQEHFLRPSFDTIAAYMQNAAIVHYHSDEKNPAVIQKKGFLLVDSGGQYLDGTTDITRTIVLGASSTDMIRDFTIVLKSHITLAKAVFAYGALGAGLDAIARLPMWQHYKNYNHGTGHGIGFCLSVHEGPQSLSMRPVDVKLEAGMLVSNEPGIYIENQYGIRTENAMIIENAEENGFGRFLRFRTVSFCPIDLDGIDPSMLTDDEKKWLNSYHTKVYQKLSPFLNDDEKDFLRKETRAL